MLTCKKKQKQFLRIFRKFITVSLKYTMFYSLKIDWLSLKDIRNNIIHLMWNVVTQRSIIHNQHLRYNARTTTISIGPPTHQR